MSIRGYLMTLGKGTVLAGLFWLLLAPSLAGATALGDFRRDVASYRQQVAVILQRHGTAEPSPMSDYLEFARKEAEYIAAFAYDVPPQPEELLRRIEDFAHGRDDRRERWLGGTALQQHPDALVEYAAWDALVAPYLSEDYLRRLVVERAVFKRRKYDEDFRESANFIERRINHSIGFLDYSEENSWLRQEGISRFESHAGFEPMVLLETDNTVGAMATIGLLYNFIPSFRQTADNRYLAEPRYRNWWHKQVVEHLKSVGVQAGAGALFDGPSAVYGLGLRIRAITFWGVYSPNDTQYSIAVGFSDFEWLRKLNFVTPF